MKTAAIDVSSDAPLTHPQAMGLQATELERTSTLLRDLDDAAWNRATDCPDWDVHHMYLHVLGACEAAVSMKENLHQLRAARRHQKTAGGPLEAGLSHVQVRERAEMTPRELVERLQAIAPEVVRKRTKMPAPLRRLTMKVDGPVVERWSLGYLTDTIYLRDLWMHRIDACRATGRELVLSADHDGRIVADVVGEWARRHASPFTLTLHGPAGGSFTANGDEPGEIIDMDAVEFCRVLAGRVEGSGLLATIVPF